ncbi:hypothetical protein [Haloferax larsenii]|uniref:hypothetical protein n=1 Tax=Haloferax larsenii TaxID=302484 RepID=UPI0011142BC8|nr:hypothetical protein [Haloferax larsenii]
MPDSNTNQTLDNSSQVIKDSKIEGDVINATQQTASQDNRRYRSTEQYIDHNTWVEIFRKLPQEQVVIKRIGIVGAVSFIASLITIYGSVFSNGISVPFLTKLENVLLIIGIIGLGIWLSYRIVKSEAKCPDCGRELAIKKHPYEIKGERYDYGDHFKVEGGIEYECDLPDCDYQDHADMVWKEPKSENMS